MTAKSRESREGSGKIPAGVKEDGGLRPAQPALGGFKNLVHKENREWLAGWSWLVHGAVWILIVAGVPLVVSFIRVAGRQFALERERDRGATLLRHGLGCHRHSRGRKDPEHDHRGEADGHGGLGTLQTNLAQGVRAGEATRPLPVAARADPRSAGRSCSTPSSPRSRASRWRFCPSWAGFGILALGMLFYLALSLLLGSVFGSRGPVAALIFGFFVAGVMLSQYAAWMTAAFPWLFWESAYYLVAQGRQIAAIGYSAIILTAVWCVVLIAAALWSFQRSEI